MRANASSGRNLRLLDEARRWGTSSGRDQKTRIPSDTKFGKDLTLYRIGKHNNPQNSPKIHQKYSKNTIFGIFGVFLPYFGCGGVSYSVGGQVFPEIVIFAKLRISRVIP